MRLLCQGEEQYRWCEEAVVPLDSPGAGIELQQQMTAVAEGVWEGRSAWEARLNRLGISSVAHRRLVFEAALCGKLLTETWYDDLALISDDAPQFKLFGYVHGLCWVHAERKIDRLILLAKTHVVAKQRAPNEFWEIYADLKAYLETPGVAQRELIQQRFDRLCTSKTGYPVLNDALGRPLGEREVFLKVLDYPRLPLHNTMSENGIREYARLRKISAATRSDLGQRCPDTSLSIKKTCRKLGVSFSAYLSDRLSGAGKIPRLSELMRDAASSRNETMTLESA